MGADEAILKEQKKRIKLFKKFGYDIQKARNFILDKAELSEGTILEIGTGKGNTAIAIAKRGFKLTSVDFDNGCLKLAKIIINNNGLKHLIRIKKMDAEKLFFSNRSFDLVFSIDFMHHAENPVTCIKEMIRVAKKKLIIADLNRRGMKIMSNVHKSEGRIHEKSKITFNKMKQVLILSGMKVTMYRHKCQNIIIAERGG